jgi:hypothetical protein
MFRFENFLLTFSQITPKKSPLPSWEEMKGGIEPFVHPSPSQRLSEPAATLTLPRRRGRILSWGNFKNVCLGFNKDF